jgi:hypothetical protein
VAFARKRAREAVAGTLAEIDALAGDLLGLSDLVAAPVPSSESDDAEEDEPGEE